MRRIWIDLPKPLRLFWLLNVLLSSSCALIMAVWRYYFHAHYPYTSPFIPFYHWIDFFCFQPRLQHLHQLDVFSSDPSFGLKFMYPAPVAVLYKFFYLFGGHALSVFFFVTMTAIALLATILWKTMVGEGVNVWTAVLFILSAAIFSYPFWFEYMLGNMEVCIFLIVAAGLLAYLRGNFYFAAALIGLAASMKIFPFVYLALLVGRGKYRQLMFGVAAAVMINLASLWVVCPSLPIAYRGIESGLAAFRYLYMLQFRVVETGFDHSIFGLIKSVAHLFGMSRMPAAWLTSYLPIVSVAGLVLYFVRIRRLPELNQIVCLCVISIFLPPTSHDYTLIHLYFSWGLMVMYAIRTVRTQPSGLMLTFSAFAVLMSAESELIVYHSGYSGQVKAIALAVLLVTALRYPWDFPITSSALSEASDGIGIGA